MFKSRGLNYQFTENNYPSPISARWTRNAPNGCEESTSFEMIRITNKTFPLEFILHFNMYTSVRGGVRLAGHEFVCIVVRNDAENFTDKLMGNAFVFEKLGFVPTL